MFDPFSVARILTFALCEGGIAASRSGEFASWHRMIQRREDQNIPLGFLRIMGIGGIGIKYH